MKKLSKMTAWILFLLTANLLAEIKIVATLPWIASVAQSIGGDKVDVTALVKGNRDPHAVEARPSMIVATRQADLLVYNGAELEVGYLPILLEASRNRKIQTGSEGHLNLALYVTIIEKPNTTIDRSLGDVHPSGNPHFHLMPENVIKVAEALENKFSFLDPDNANTYHRNLQQFQSLMENKIKAWDKKMSSLKEKKVILYHRDMNYLTKRYGLEVIGYLEPKPGIQPTPRHLKSIIGIGKKEKTVAILVNSYFDKKLPARVAEKTGGRLMVLPIDVGGVAEAKDYISLMDIIIATLSSLGHP